MQLTIHDVARLLKVPSRTVYRWLDDGELPACRVNDDVRFNRAELLEWATLRGLPVSGLPEQGGGSLADALAAGVAARLEIRDPAALARAMVAALPLGPDADRETLLEVLLARGPGAMTPVGGGVAIPHVRHPALLALPRPVLSLFRLADPVELGAPDGRPVRTLFFLLSVSVKGHLHLLSRLAAALQDGAFKAALEGGAGLDALSREAGRLEGLG